MSHKVKHTIANDVTTIAVQLEKGDTTEVEAMC